MSDDVNVIRQQIAEKKRELQQLELQLRVFEKLDDNKNCFSMSPNLMCNNCFCWKRVREMCS